MAKLQHEMTLAEYAAHRKCSTVAVHKKAAAGDIPRRLEMAGKQKLFFYDPILCDAAWIGTTDADHHSATPIPPTTTMRKGRPIQVHADALKTIKEAAKAQNQKQGARIPQNHSTRTGTPPKPGKPQDGPQDGEEMPLALRKSTAQVAKLEAEAARAQIELEQAAGKLAVSEDLEDLFAALVADARDRILNLPPSLRAQFPELPQEVITFVADYIAAMLAGLARPGRKHA